MDPVHDRGSMDPVQSGGPWTPGPCFVLTQKKIRLYDFPVIALRTFLSSFDNTKHEMAISVLKEGLLRSRNLVTMVK